MREIQSYHSQIIGICDDGPLGFKDGTYIACLQSNGWSLYLSQSETLVNGYPEHQGIPDKSLAIQRIKSLIDQDLERWRRAEVEFVANVEADKLALIQKEERRRQELFSAGDAEIPVKLLIRLHNECPSDSNVRADLLSFIKATARSRGKAHWTRGIRVLPDGCLSFSERDFTIAVYRGKQETRTDSMMELVEKLSGEFEMFRTFHASESFFALRVNDEPGEPLIEVSECSARLSQLRERIVEMQSNLTVQDFTIQALGSASDA